MPVIKQSITNAKRHLRSAVDTLNGQEEDLANVEHQLIHNAANQAMEAARELYRLAGILEAQNIPKEKL